MFEIWVFTIDTWNWTRHGTRRTLEYAKVLASHYRQGGRRVQIRTADGTIIEDQEP